MGEKVLVTGMTARQYSGKVVEQSASFTQALVVLLNDVGCSVSVAQPQIEWSQNDFAEFDQIWVGVAALTSLAANGALAALSTLAKLHGDPRLRLFVDAPEHWQIFASLRAVERNEATLFKPLYSRRIGYAQALSDETARRQVTRGAEILTAEPWPTTLFPLLPWSDEAVMKVGAPANVISSLAGINPDAVYADRDRTKLAARSSVWLAHGEKSRWTSNVLTQASWSHTTTRREKARTDAEISALLTRVGGLVIGPSDDKKHWWSPLYAQALNNGAPVVTEWRNSGEIGSAWLHLVATVESMSAIDRFELAVTQRRQYFDSVCSREETASQLCSLLET